MGKISDVISVIVPIYNVEDFLDECICSIVNQTYHNLQIILVDDGSKDNCGKICEKWAEKDKRIKVLHKNNGGLSDARNAGLVYATGDYIAFVDSDDWIDPNMYEIMLSVLKRESADIVACGIVDTYSEKEIIHSSPYDAGSSEKFLKLIYQDTVFPVASWNKLYRKELWKDFKFPKGKICEDAFTTYLLVDRASRIVQIPDVLYHYRIRKNSIMTLKFRAARMNEEEAWRKNYLYMRNHYPDIAILAYDFYLQKVNILFHMISPEQYDEFQKEYKYLYNILCHNLKYVLFKSRLNYKYRIRFLIDIIKIKRNKRKWGQTK